jgi:hypothetical protein
MSTPIELAPRRAAWLREGAGWVHLALALAIVLGVFVQVYLIGAYIFGAGQVALDAHRATGFTVQGLEILVLVAALIARVPRRDLGLSLALAVIGTAQAGLANAHGWTGGLHPLFALVVLTLAVTLARRSLRAHSG